MRDDDTDSSKDGRILRVKYWYSLRCNLYLPLQGSTGRDSHMGDGGPTTRLSPGNHRGSRTVRLITTQLELSKKDRC